MLLPIGDEPNAHETPWVNYALIAANVLAFVFVQRAGVGPEYEASLQRYAYVPAAPSLSTAFTSMFMHGSWLHLGGNMLYLWIFGDNVEARLGRLGYLAAYLATGLAAGLFHGVSDPASAVPSLGASGAISGVQGIYLLACPRNRVKLLFWWFVVVNVILVPAPVVILLWFALNDLLPYLVGRSTLGGVAHAAHLGGFGTGVVLCLVARPFLRPGPGPEAWRAGASRARPGAPVPWGRDLPYSGGRVASQPDLAPSTDEETIGDLWRAGRRGPAAEAFAAALKAGRPVSLPEADFLWMALWLEQQRRYDDARRAYDAFLDAYPSSRGAALVSLSLGLLLARHGGDPAEARAHLDQAARAATDPFVREAALRELERLGP